MSLRDIRLVGDPVLRTRASEVTTFDRSLRRLVSDMVETMADANGLGLAAPQVGVGLRVFVYRIWAPGEPTHGLVGHLVNPLVEVEDPTLDTTEEGCLSVPDLHFPLARPRGVVARGLLVDEEPLEVRGDPLLARCLQHETDHLDGVLFLDRLAPEERKRALRALREMGEHPVVKRSPHGPH